MCLDPNGLVGQEESEYYCFRCAEAKNGPCREGCFCSYMSYDPGCKFWFSDCDHYSYHTIQKHPEKAKTWGNEAHVLWLKAHYEKKLGL